MPSDNMERFPVDLYPEQTVKLRQIIRSHKVKRSRFLRECVKYVLANDKRLATVINKAKLKNYSTRLK